jgi:hypothetical protein
VVPGQKIKDKIERWMDNQRLVTWRGHCSIQTQAWELISGPKLATKARLLFLKWTQYRVVIGLVAGRNILIIHLRGCFEIFRTYAVKNHETHHKAYRPPSLSK